MKKSELYTQDELELFEMLENNVENKDYKPTPTKELEEAKTYYQKVAQNTIKKMTKKKALNIRIYEEDLLRRFTKY